VAQLIDEVKKEVQYYKRIKRAKIDWNKHHSTNDADILISELPLLHIALDALNNEIVPENVLLNGNADIIELSVGEQWHAQDKNYDLQLEILAKIVALPEVRFSDTYVKQFNYTNQGIPSITKTLSNIINGDIPDSVLNQKALKKFQMFAQGGHQNSLKAPLHEEKCKTYDIRRCHTAIAYERRHGWPIFTPWCQWEYFDGTEEIIGGAFYTIRQVELGQLKLGDGVYDSEFTEYALNNNYITLQQIEDVLVPWKTLPNDYFVKLIDLVYENFTDNQAKQMINTFLGTLSSGFKEQCTQSFITTSDTVSHEWMSRSDDHERRFMAGSWLCYLKKTPTVTSTNIGMFYS
jgi:hypothetical protein